MVQKIKDLFNHRSQTISSAAIVVAAFSVFGALLGILRNALLASRFGAGAELDVYYASFRIPDFVYGIFYLGVVSVLFLPIFNDLFMRDKDRAWRFFGAMVSWIAIILGLGAAVLAFAAPEVVRFIVPGFNAEQRELVTAMTRLMLVQPILLGVSNIVSGALQSFQRFIAAALGHVFYNLGIIFGIVILVPTMGISGLAWGVVLGAVLHLVIQLPSLAAVRAGRRIRLFPDLSLIRPHLRLVPPRIFNVISNQVNLFAITILASTAAAGSLTVFNLAHDIQMLPQTAIAVSLAVAAFPAISRVAFHNKARFRAILDSVLRNITFFLIPAALFLLVFRAQVVRLVLGYGAFGWEDTILTLDTLMIFAVGIVFQGLLPFLVRAFFSLHNTMIPLVSALAGNGITIGLGIMLLPRFGVMGLAAALVAANIAQAGILLFELARRGYVNVGRLAFTATRITAASAAAALSGRAFLEIFDRVFFTPAFNGETVVGLATQTAFAGIGGLAVLVMLFHVFRVQEYREFAAGFRRRFFRNGKPVALPPDEFMGGL